MQNQCIFYRQRIIGINFDFCKTVRNSICDATFYTYKISNFVVNSIKFVLPNNVKYQVLSEVLIIPSLFYQI